MGKSSVLYEHISERGKTRIEETVGKASRSAFAFSFLVSFADPELSM